MSHTNLGHRRTHNTLLISRLLNQREGASPFTLVIDSLEQPAKILLKEYLRRATVGHVHYISYFRVYANQTQSSKGYVIYLAFETVQVPENVNLHIPCWNKSPAQIIEAVNSTVAKSSRRCLLIIDSLTTLCIKSTKPHLELNLTGFLMSLLQSSKQNPQSPVTLVAVYHQDIPFPATAASYLPSPLTLLEYLATTIITLHSLSVLLAEKEARAKSVSASLLGLSEQKDGILVGLKPHMNRLAVEERGIVLQLEHRRKSGRGVLEWYFLPDRIPGKTSQSQANAAFREHICLLDDHPRLKGSSPSSQETDQELAGMTFQLGLTERQRLERDGVVLPYFDAQKAGGVGDGGRILYDMGEEDDFDEEEDEI